MIRKILRISLLLCLLTVLIVSPLQAATPEQIEDSIQSGLDWMVPQQHSDGYWSPGYEPVALTALTLVKLEERAYETGYDPFDPAYMYNQNVIDGLNWLFKQASVSVVGICFGAGSHETYNTGIAMMAIAASRKPDQVVNVGSVVDGLTYKQVLQANVDYFAWGQCDSPSPQQGGWAYGPNQDWADQSNTGYAVLGLRYAEADLFGFKCLIPAFVKSELNIWIDFVQEPDGGSDYDGFWNFSTLLRTGNLLFEMAFVGDTVTTPRVQNAIAYIQNNWVGGTDSQEMYCLMKGFQSLDIDTITVGGSPTDWFDQFADHIIANQDPGGYWDFWWGMELDTVFCLLTLEKVAPPPPVNVEVSLPECSCDDDGYTVDVTYTVERFNVDGNLNIYEDGILVRTVELANFTGTDIEIIVVDSDTPGTHTWRAELDVAPVGGGTPAQSNNETSLEVCETPQVVDIPDQNYPFYSFDLDDYLTYSGASAVTWSASAAAGWTIAIDAENVVTVTPPDGTSDPAAITFTARTECCDNVICSDSEVVTFTPYLPMCFGINDLKIKQKGYKCKGVTQMTVTSDQGEMVFNPGPGKDKLGANTVVDDGVNGPVTIHTSCSKPLDIGDVFGAYTVFDLTKIFDDHDSGNEIKIKGTFSPSMPIDLNVDDVTFTVDDGAGNIVYIVIPAGSFAVEGKPDHNKFKFKSDKGDEPHIDAKLDLHKCKFDLKVKKAAGAGELTGTSLTVALLIGIHFGEELIEVEAKHHDLKYKAKPKLDCCKDPKCKGVAWMELTSDQGTFLYEPTLGKDKLKATTVVDDGVNGPQKIHTSCSKPIDIGDVFGAYTITDLVKIFE